MAAQGENDVVEVWMEVLVGMLVGMLVGVRMWMLVGGKIRLFFRKS